jgi:hypothetical protein
MLPSMLPCIKLTMLCMDDALMMRTMSPSMLPGIQTTPCKDDDGALDVARAWS